MGNIYKRILERRMGWRVETSVPLPDKCVICVAPHTSNWDFIIGELYIRSIGKTANFLMKKEWFFWPLGGFMRRIGGIPVERSRKTSLTDQLAEAAEKAETFRLAVTPEGTGMEAWLLLHSPEGGDSHHALCHRLRPQAHRVRKADYSLWRRRSRHAGHRLILPKRRLHR